MNYELTFLKALALTILIETSVLLMLIKIIFRKLNLKIWIILLAGITASFATLPYLWFIIPLWIKTKLYYVIFSEGLAILLESFILAGILRIKYSYALGLSAACNIISYLIGLFIF